MTIILQTQRYCPHEITTKLHSVEFYRQTGNVSYVCRKYHISKASLIQTDNGSEFTHFNKTIRIHTFDKFCDFYGIIHKLIRPRTPWNNGKVERSHRNDQERFYNYLCFYSFQTCKKTMNGIGVHNYLWQVLVWKSTNQKKELKQS